MWVSPIDIKANSRPDLTKIFPGHLKGGGERKDIHLSLSPELVHKEARCLLTAGRCLSRHQPRKLCHLARLLAPISETSGQPKHHRAGRTVCAGSSQALPCSLFLPSRTPACRLRRTVWLGPAVACPLGIRSSSYPESVWCCPWTDLERAGLLATSLAMSFMYWVEEGPGRGVWRRSSGREERGVGITMPGCGRFFDFCFPKKIDIIYHEEEE